jgi:hypothetical protein
MNLESAQLLPKKETASLSTTREEGGGESCTAQISRNARSEQSTRRDGQRAAEIDHAGESAAVEDVETVLEAC